MTPGNLTRWDPAPGKGSIGLRTRWWDTREVHRNLMNVFTKQQRIASLARQHRDWIFTSLAHHIDLDWLRAAYERTRKDAAPGVDGRTAQDYAENLDENLSALLERLKTASYIAPPVKRKHIPKGDKGRQTRPIGIPTFEDKVLQRAVVMVLEPIYEEEFHSGSYGFRPGRSAHDALESLWQQTMRMSGGWILDVDIQKFFDTLDHARLRSIVKQRVCDGVITRLISKWLHAGVLEDGSISYPGQGTPQGGVISPLLSNIYLHEVLDKWFKETVTPRLRGRAYLLRYADDFVIGLERKDDAERVLAVLPKRFAKYGLTIHPDKTRLVPFRRPKPDSTETGNDDDPPPGTFDFLGFTHYWGTSRRGKWVVQRKTATGRLARSVRAVYQWCKRRRHDPVCDQHAALSRKVRGHYGYYGITGNYRRLDQYYRSVQRAWRQWLTRRSRERKQNWERFSRLVRRYPLPRPRIVHSAFAAKP